MLVYVSKPFLAYLVNGPYKDPDGVGFANLVGLANLYRYPYYGINYSSTSLCLLPWL